jgi:hypothetical protein
MIAVTKPMTISATMKHNHPPNIYGGGMSEAINFHGNASA